MTMRDLKRMFAGTAMLLAIGATDALAVPTGYNSLATFQTDAATASIPLTVDNLDFLADSPGLVASIDRGAYSINDNDNPPASMTEQNNSAGCEGGAQPTTGCVVVTAEAGGFTFTFDNPINAFGFLLGKGVLVTGLTSLTLNDVLINGNFSGGDPQYGFFGIIDTAASFTSVTLAGISNGTQFAIDTVRFGAAETQGPPPNGGGNGDGGTVPEPSSALLLLGVPALWAAVRRARSGR